MFKYLVSLFENHFGVKCDRVEPLKAHASDRRIVRLGGGGHLAIGVENANRAENKAFVEFGRSLGQVGINVPKIYATDLERGVYLQEDLGNVTLYSLIEKSGGTLDAQTFILYERAVTQLVKFNVLGAAAVDYNLCFAGSEYGPAGFSWDLKYFRDSFLKRSTVAFNEVALEHDFEKIVSYLEGCPRNYLIHRDYQARNLMVVNDDVYCIDFERARRGPLYYDLAKLLYQSKLTLTADQHQRLEQVYVNELCKLGVDATSDFQRYYPGFTLLQFLHRLGAFGRFGLGLGQAYFLECIPPAIQKIKQLREKFDLLRDLPELSRIIDNLATQDFGMTADDILPKALGKQVLKVHLGSFAYKNGMPDYLSVGGSTTSGGGFVFDCRLMPNPGREEKYKQLTGKNAEVIEYLNAQDRAIRFRDNVRAIVTDAVRAYQERGFSELIVLFGCTGGQHRSVWLAEYMKRELLENFAVNITIKHREIEP